MGFELWAVPARPKSAGEGGGFEKKWKIEDRRWKWEDESLDIEN